MDCYSGIKRNKVLTHDMKELWGHWVKRMKPDMKGHISYDPLTHMTYPEENIYRKQTGRSVGWWGMGTEE